MSDKKTAIKEELSKLIVEYQTLSKMLDSVQKAGEFGIAYQNWYTKTLKIVEQLAPDRLDEFIGYYRIDQKRKSFNPQTYVIQDYVMGISPKFSLYDENKWNTNEVTSIKLLNQLQILSSLHSRIDGVLANLEATLYAELQDAELEMASRLKSTNLRAAGSLAGVVLESHLQKIAATYSIKISKKDPTISELNDPLKNAGVYHTPTWRKIQFLGDIRNLCSHKKSDDPTPQQVDELISGVNEIKKTVF
jgi:hypothetical protein